MNDIPKTSEAAGTPSNNCEATAERLFECSAKLERENARLRCAIQTAIDYANGRESEWGERAEGAFAVLYSALANVTDEQRRGKDTA